ncbi:MAG: glycosyltransferase [Flavobacteriaceae bacterium]
MKTKSLKILFVQRVITRYRLDLLKTLCNDFKQVGIITSKGNKSGTLKLAKYNDVEMEFSNIKIYKLSSLRINYKGESRATNFFIYPKSIRIIKEYDIIVFEGTTNLLNNLYLVPYSKLLRKKTLWWDAGYSLPNRTFKRKIIDRVIKPFVMCTDAQMAYSTLALKYLTNYMGAKNAFLNLNTINTSYFDVISREIEESINSYKFDKNNIKLLYVGVIEERKKIKELIDIVSRLNKSTSKKRFSLTIIGGGNQLNEINKYINKNKQVCLLGPIYEKNELKPYYFKSDLFVLPGDGGLAILQSLLFGLPVLSIKGADGTELDYIKDKSFLVESVTMIEDSLKRLTNIDRKKIICNLPDIKHFYWTETLKSLIMKL